MLLGFPLGQQKFEKGLVIATLVVAVPAGAVCAFDIIDVNRIAGDLEDEGLATADVGVGLYIAGLGALAAAGASGLALRAHQSVRPDIQGPPTRPGGDGPHCEFASRHLLHREADTDAAGLHPMAHMLCHEALALCPTTPLPDRRIVAAGKCDPYHLGQSSGLAMEGRRS